MKRREFIKSVTIGAGAVSVPITVRAAGTHHSVLGNGLHVNWPRRSGMSEIVNSKAWNQYFDDIKHNY